MKDLKPTVGGPHQAHHIVPWDMMQQDGPVKDMLGRIKFSMNDVNNGVHLPTVSCGTNHCGPHGAYSTAMKNFLTRVAASGKTDDEMAEIIHKGMLEARKNFGVTGTGAGGVSLGDGAEWQRILRRIL